MLPATRSFGLVNCKGRLAIGKLAKLGSLIYFLYHDVRPGVIVLVVPEL